MLSSLQSLCSFTVKFEFIILNVIFLVDRSLGVSLRIRQEPRMNVICV